MCDTAALADGIKATIAANKVVVYSKSWCPFCSQTKILFDSLKVCVSRLCARSSGRWCSPLTLTVQVDYATIELDELDNGADIQGVHTYSADAMRAHVHACVYTHDRCGVAAHAITRLRLCSS